MKFTRPSRVIAAIITIFSLLFTQLALASYACPELNMARPAMMTDHEGSMAGCANMDMPSDQAALCHSHCAAGDQRADTPQAPLVQPFVAAQLSVVVRVVEKITFPDTAPAESVSLARSTAPPLSIRHCCFRI